MLDKFRIPEMVLGALFASSLWAGIWGSTDSYAPTEKQKQECYDTAQKTGQKSDECKTFWERTTSDPVAFFTLVLAVSTVGLWVATGALYIAGERQIEIAKQSANAARDAAEHIPRVERAYLFLWHELKHKITPNPCGGEILEVQFALRNQGKTPAIPRRIEVDIRIVDIANGYPATLREIASDMPPGMVLSSDETSAFLPRRQLIMPEHWDIVRRRQGLLLFLGRVEYSDVFRDPHVTGFCLEWDGNGFSPSPTETLNYYT